MNSKQSIHTMLYGLDEIERVADYLYSLKDICAVYTFTGSLGAGKTTLVQALLRRFGVAGPIASPTFTYVQIYAGNDRQTIYHFDTYRLPSINAFIASGFDEYLYQPNSYAFIEWPEIIEPLLRDRVCRVSLEYQDLEKRLMTCVEG
ncbi:tRNA (adenosine(37)-N6)-threonylcarbamoyltransferase complex ATPase subunit type 1 TsaE [Candidatus Dependentiae bacterium]|nr:tRNA (adenosine(37)-N6)-threonylcarbamoyltransferase complex ATPase subunit type 1 TsaE [Candidatus Dependentiae bacterium]MCC7414483.1 tRNA (adenosine(37)-N6)-threonylcarbamoyltransferase complex ATPase subunit type 1 TsaE [Campylobacterota bacterium]